MTSIPRIITVDPQAHVSRLVRAAIDLIDRPVIQVDVRGSREALDEIERGGYDLVVSALQVDRQAHGFALATSVRELSPSTAVIIVADADDPEEADVETDVDSPFVYLRRPVDAAYWLQVVRAALLGQYVQAVPLPNAGLTALTPDDFGPVPALDRKAAATIVEALLTDIGARAVMLSTRTGDILLERGVKGTLERGGLAQALMPTVRTTLHMSELTSSTIATLQYFDGDNHDIFVLSAGYHHFLTLIFDGQTGARQFGAVTRFGRRAAEDLKALLGSAAHTLQATSPPAPPVEAVVPPEDVVEPVAVRAETWEPDPPASLPEVEFTPEPEIPTEPIGDFDLSILDGLATLDDSAADDLFDPDRLAKIASEQRSGRGPLSYDEARDLGIVP